MRLATILALLARQISISLFRPAYIASSDSSLRKSLLSLASTDNEKESFTRLLLLSVDAIDQERVCSAAMQTTVCATVSYFDGLFFSRDSMCCST